MCQFPWTHFLVNCYGEATVCCTMNSSALFGPVNVGRVTNQDLLNFWQRGDLITQLRVETLSNKWNRFKKVCVKCSEKFMNMRENDRSTHSDCC